MPDCGPGPGRAEAGAPGARGVYAEAPVSPEFAAICAKLSMPEPLRRWAWDAYHLLRSRTAHTRAGCAAQAVGAACRAAGFPASEERVRGAVAEAMGARRAPDAAGAAAELHEDAERLGLDSGGHSPWLYLELEMSSARGLLPDEADFDQFRAAAMRAYQSARGAHRGRARRAVMQALGAAGAHR